MACFPAPERKSRKEKAADLTVVALLMIGAFYGGSAAYRYLSPQQAFRQAIDSITAKVEVQAFHPGQSVPYATRTTPNDLMTDNFNDLMLGIFTNSPAGGAVIIPQPWKNTLGTAESDYIWSTTTYYGFTTTNGVAACGASTAECGGRLSIGNSYSTPTRTDTQITTILGAWFNAASSTCNTGATDSVVVSGSVVTGSTSNTPGLQEAGLYIYGYSAGASSREGYLLAHDIFTPAIAETSGDTVTVTYTLSLNAVGITTNFCYLLAALIAPITANSANVDQNTVGLVSVGGGTTTFGVWCGMGTVGVLTTTTNCGAAYSSNDVFMGIGTGSGGTPPTFTPASHNLASQYATATAQVASYTSATGVVALTYTFTLGSTQTINEAGLFLILSSTNFAFFLISFTGQTFASSTATGISMELTD